LSGLYLLDAEVDSKGIRLYFYDPEESRIVDVVDTEYKPYFLVPHPLSPDDEKVVVDLGARTENAQKIDLFGTNLKTVTRVILENPAEVAKASERFKESWEGEVPYTLGYVYDHDLNFGIPYSLEEGKPKPLYEVSIDLKRKFEEKFSDVKAADPSKYELLERFFTLSSQKIPEIPLERFGVTTELDERELYLMFTLSRIVNLPLPIAHYNRKVSTWIRSILHAYMRKKNILIPTSSELRRGETIRGVQGALTFQPRSGMYFNTVVLDFESLYPSLIDAYNLSYETVNCEHPGCINNRVPGLDHHVCTLRRGFYSILIGALKDLRIHWFKPFSRDSSIPVEERRSAETASSLLKLILVSCYGVTVRIHGLAQLALAESITAYGRYALQESWNSALNAGLSPIYGDTDSLFLDNPGDEQINRLIHDVKKRLRLDLAVEKRYSLCVLPRAMKAYFGIQRDGTPDIKGVVAIKSNSPLFIQKVFNSCVKELREVKNPAEFEAAKGRIRRGVQKSIDDLRIGRIPLEDLEYTVKLHFDPSEKTVDEEMIHQPYQCAIQLVATGRQVRRGDTISFIKVKPFAYKGRPFTVKPTSLVRSFNEVNMEDYVRNLQTALDQTFKPMSITFEKGRAATLVDFL